MTRTERIYRINQLLKNRPAVPRRELLDALEISSATLTRDLEHLRDRLHAPIVFDANLGGYRFDTPNPHAPVYALPGLWLNESEIHALLAMEKFIETMQPGLLAPHIAPLKKRLHDLLGKGACDPEEVRRRILLLTATPRHAKLEHFEVCVTATLLRQRLRLTHYDRYINVALERDVSPQRIVRYKENWYLDTWCHLRGAIRTFAIDALKNVSLLDTPAKNVSDEEIDAVLGAGYGIYAGQDVTWATLRFTPYQARWTAQETWHSDQRAHWEPDGSYILEVPYSGEGELLMDILKYGPAVEVLAPEGLRQTVAARLEAAAGRYRS